MKGPMSAPGAIRKTAVVLALCAAWPGAAPAHFFGPPEFSAEDRHYALVEAACATVLDRHESDTVFSLGGAVLFLRAGAPTDEEDGKHFAPTFIIHVGPPHQCLGTVRSRPAPLYGSTLKTKSSSVHDTVVLDMDAGKLEVTQDGTFILLPQ